tara:strand:+ start:1712 stop:2419 length:708 start_codon:yes stop_codon:yes gene_type:complete
VSIKSKNSELEATLRLLQYGDSFFPSGTLAFSSGLETLSIQKRVTNTEELKAFIKSQLYGRWNGLDRPCLTAAFKASQGKNNIRRLIEIDKIMDCNTLPAELRSGSILGGKALLGVHKNLGTPHVSDYREIIKTGDGLGHLPVAQGICFAGCEMDYLDSQIVGMHTLVIGLSSAAIRLGIIGHIDAQRLIEFLREDIAKILSTDTVEPEDSWSFSPISDIAVMQHETQDTRLFTN